MAINVNTVYQTVLLILNKEQRGYITPQEFNNIANQVQLEIFNSYFPDGNQANRLNQTNQQNDTEFYNSFDVQDARLDPFKLITTEFVYNAGKNAWVYPSNSLPISKIGSVYCNYNNRVNYKEADRLSYKEFRTTAASKLTAPTQNYPIFNITYVEQDFEQTLALVNYIGGNVIEFAADSNINFGNGVYNKTQQVSYGTVNSLLTTTPTTQVQVTEDLTLLPAPVPGDEILIVKADDIALYPNLFIEPQPSSIEVSAVQVPGTVTWGYQLQANGSYLYDPNSSSDFQLVQDEQSRLVLEILKYCGVLIRDPQIAQQAAQAEAVIEANEKR
jgi:hypothetical protein